MGPGDQTLRARGSEHGLDEMQVLSLKDGETTGSRTSQNHLNHEKLLPMCFQTLRFFPIMLRHVPSPEPSGFRRPEVGLEPFG